jgi:hypothetical protein
MKKIKLNWGTGIVISIVIFIVITIVTVVIFMNQDVDLVTDNYYEKTLVYQDVIDIQKRTNTLDEDIKITSANSFINISFPKSFLKDISSGEIYFYRPSDSKKDFIIPLHLNVEGSQLLSSSEMIKGLWKISVNWTMNNLEYQTSKSIFIN